MNDDELEAVVAPSLGDSSSGLQRSLTMSAMS